VKTVYVFIPVLSLIVPQHRSLRRMLCVILTALMLLLSEATQSDAESIQSSLPSVPQWYKPCSNGESRSQNQRLEETLSEYLLTHWVTLWKL